MVAALPMFLSLCHLETVFLASMSASTVDEFVAAAVALWPFRDEVAEIE